MKGLFELIELYEKNATRKEDNLIKVKLKMISNLLEEIGASEDRIFMEEIINAFAEIVETQRTVIENLENEEDEDDKDFEYDGSGLFQSGPALGRLNYMPSTTRVSVEEIPWVDDEGDLPIEVLRERNPYTPPIGEFRTDEQIRKAFSNYLKYHTVKETKDGRQKPFSKYTVFDYCSRINILWKSLFAEWQDGKLEGIIEGLEESIIPGSTFLNVYQNIHTVQVYLDIKGIQIREIAAGDREPFTEEEMKINPLNNPKNLGNTVAALAKFIEFKSSI